MIRNPEPSEPSIVARYRAKIPPAKANGCIPEAYELSALASPHVPLPVHMVFVWAAKLSGHLADPVLVHAWRSGGSVTDVASLCRDILQGDLARERDVCGESRDRIVDDCKCCQVFFGGCGPGVRFGLVFDRMGKRAT